MAALDDLKTQIKIHVRKSDMSDADVSALASAALKDLCRDIPELKSTEYPADYVPALAARAAYRYFLGDIGSVRDEKRAAVFLRAYKEDVFGGGNRS